MTLITHGRDGHLWGFVDTVANDIINARLGGPSKVSEYILKLTPDPNDGHLIPSITRINNTVAPQNNPTGEIILEVDYTSVDTNASYHLDYIASVIRDYFINTPVDGVRLAELPLHEISISRGTGLCDEIARSLGQVGVWVDQETYCDPNPVEVMGDRSPTIYDNVAFVDDYWRSDGNPANTSTNGSPTNGAYNLNVWWLDQYHSGWALNHLLPGGYYVGTIDLTTTNGGEGPIYPQWYGTTPDKPARNQTGYIYSRIVSGAARPLSGVWPASGGSGYREPGLAPSGAQWPNLTDVASVGGTSFSTSQQIPISYIYQDRDSASTVTFYLDPDRNPYNNNFAATIGSAQLNQSNSINSAQTMTSAAGVASGTYWIATKVVDSGGRFRFAYGKQISLVNNTPPPAPTGLNATGSVGKVSLSWTDNSGSESGFDIQRAGDSSFTTGVRSSSVGANVQSYDDTSVTSNTTYFYRVRSTNGTLNSEWSNVKQITTPTWTASLSGSFANAAGSYNFTTLNADDWAHWNGTNADGTAASIVHKSSGGSAVNLIGNVARYPSANNVGHYGIYADPAETQMTWTDGTPVASATNDKTKLWQNAATLGQGWTLTVPADTTTRTLNLLTGSYTAGMTISAHLSDNSFQDYNRSDLGSSGVVRQVYTFTYAAASAGQSLIITLTKSANNNGHTDGSVDLLGAWLTVSAAPPPPGAPGTPVLAEASDTGASSSDGITNINTPTITGTAAANSTVKIYADATQVGSGSADGSGGYSVNVSALPDGTHVITATATTSGGTSPASSPITITIDTAAPTIAAGSFNFQTSQNLTYDFSENVGSSLAAGDWALTNLTTSSDIASASINVAWDGSTKRATLSFPGLAQGMLPDGNYLATISAAGVTDLAGNPLAADHVMDFFFVGGDANHDRTVDVTDLGILASNWQQTGKTVADGDFNYDGVVDVTDLGILASKWQSVLPA